MKAAVQTLYTLRQVLERLPIHPQSLRRHIWQGHIPSVRVGKRIFVSEATMIELTTNGLQWTEAEDQAKLKPKS